MCAQLSAQQSSQAIYKRTIYLQHSRMSTDLSKPDTEVTVSLDTILDMDEGEDNILGQANISDLLDTDVGADISGHQSETQSAYEKGTWEQPHPVTDSKSPPQDQEASSCMAQQGCQPVAELATLMQQVLSRLAALEVENIEVEDPEEASAVNIIAVPGAIVEGLTNPGLGVMVDNKSPKLPLRSQHPSPPTVSSSPSDF